MPFPQLGKAPAGARLEKINRSANYKDGKFQNQSYTPMFAEGANYYTVIKQVLFGKDKRNIPHGNLPSRVVNLKALNLHEDLIVWFGHSSYYMQLAGKRILVDPVFSGGASPLSFGTRAFKGADVYTAADMPEIDYLFISHDHYDHLDHKTIVALKGKVKKVVTGLGGGAHFEYWGYDPALIIEKDWYEEVVLDDVLTVHTAPARHFSGRSLNRNNTLWMSFVLKSPNKTIYLGGDSGYDKHFAEIGAKYGPFDLAILESGQYNISWKYIHMLPEEVVQAAIDLKTKILFPVHWGKFALALHAWDESIIKVLETAEQKGISVMHPMIGEVSKINGNNTYNRWWEQVA